MSQSVQLQTEGCEEQNNINCSTKPIIHLSVNRLSLPLIPSRGETEEPKIRLIVVFGGSVAPQNKVYLTAPNEALDLIKAQAETIDSTIKFYLKSHLSEELDVTSQYMLEYNSDGPIKIENINYKFDPDNTLEFLYIEDTTKYCPMLFLNCSRDMVSTIFKELTSVSRRIYPLTYCNPESVFNSIFQPVSFTIDDNLLNFRYNVDERKVSHDLFLRERDTFLESYGRKLVEDTRSKTDSLLCPKVVEEVTTDGIRLPLYTEIAPNN